MVNRRRFLCGCLRAAAAASLSPLVQAAESPDLSARIVEAVRAAVGLLAGKQSEDGAWRSDVYGPFKDGPSLTSLIGATLAALPENAAALAVADKAVRYLTKLVSADGNVVAVTEGITYPVYTAAGAIKA